MKIALTLATISLGSAALACEPVESGSLIVDRAWSRATISKGRPGVFYVEITNTGSEDDALTGLEADIATMPMLHQTLEKDGVVSMPHVAAIPLPAGETVRLAPGGYHGMMMGLETKLAEGDSFPLTLVFQSTPPVEVTVRVGPLTASTSPCDAEVH